MGNLSAAWSADPPLSAIAITEIDKVLCRRVLVDTEPTPTLIQADLDVRPSLFDDEPARFAIRVADNQGHREAAGYLVRKMYGWRGYDVGAGSAVPDRLTLIASTRSKILATLTVGFESPHGLAAESLYPDELDSLRRGGGRLCEFTRLAVDRVEQSKELLAMMFHVAYMYARRLNDKTDLLIEVNPRHVRFYQRMLGFRPLGPERICPRVNAPALLMWLPLEHAEQQIAIFGGHREMADKVKSLYPLFFSPAEEKGICARLRAAG